MIDKRFGRLQAIINILFFLSLFTLVFFLGTIFNQYEWVLQKNMPNTNPNKDLNAKIEVKSVESHITSYIEKPKEQIELRNFSTLNELHNWLFVKRNLTSYYTYATRTDLDCDDYASELQRKALKDGYIMSFQIIDAQEYNKIFEKYPIPLNTRHAINLVLIENNAYYIEPQTGEIQLAAYLD